MRRALLASALATTLVLTSALAQLPDSGVPKKEKGSDETKAPLAKSTGVKTKDKRSATQLVGLQIDVPEDCKITINDKPITYDKFVTVMEFAGAAFETEELILKEGRMQTLKLRTQK
jgi:hypothetical protein